MTDVEIIDTDRKPAPPVPTNRKTGKPLTVTGKVSALLNSMIEHGLSYQDAAKHVGMHVRKARQALDKPHVLQELKRRKQVFRASISAANILRLAEIRDQCSNQMASLGAIKALEQIDDESAATAGRNRAPGLVVNIISDSAHTAHIREIEAKPLILHDDHDNGSAGE